MRSFSFAIAASLITVALTGLSQTAHAQSAGSEPLSNDNAQALSKTQNLMIDQAQRDAYVNTNAAAKTADEQVKQLMGPNTEATYGLAAEIFGDMVRQAHGDPKLLNQMVEEAQRNPAAFAAKWSAAQKQKLHGLANEVEKRNNQAPAPH